MRRDARHAPRWKTAREQIAALAGARARDVVFTSSGTEANAAALWGAVFGAIDADARLTRLFVSAIEHDSVRANADAIAGRVAGVRVVEIPAQADGTIDTEALRILLREGKGRALVATMAANNETGVLQPLGTIAALAKDAGALLLVDAVQAAGRVTIDRDSLGADYLTLSAHKIGGPQGVGAVIVKDGAPFAPLIGGGGQERGRRGGTENVTGIAGFGAAAQIAGTLADVARLTGLRDRFERELLRLHPRLRVFGANASRLCNVSNFALEGMAAETALMALDLDGVRLSSGSACSSGKVRASHVLRAMGVGEDEARCALRVSFGWTSGDQDVDAALGALERLAARLRVAA